MPILQENESTIKEKLLCDCGCGDTTPLTRYNARISPFSPAYENQAIVNDGVVLRLNCLAQKANLPKILERQVRQAPPHL